MTAAVLALWAGLAAAQDWPKLSPDFHRHTVSLLGRLPSLRRHAAFFLKERLDLSVTDSLERVDDHVLGSYDPIERRLFVDQVVLLDAADELEEKGLPRADVPEVLAWKALPLVAHEAAHALTHRELERRMGEWVVVTAVENEMVAFYDEVLCLRDMFKLRPKLWDRERVLDFERGYASVLGAVDDSPAQLDALVRRLYSHLPSLLEGPPEPILEKVDGTIAWLEKRLEGTLEPEDAEYTAVRLDLHRRYRAAVADPKRRDRLKAFYRQELDWRLKRLKAA